MLTISSVHHCEFMDTKGLEIGKVTLGVQVLEFLKSIQILRHCNISRPCQDVFLQLFDFLSAIRSPAVGENIMDHYGQLH